MITVLILGKICFLYWHVGFSYFNKKKLYSVPRGSVSSADSFEEKALTNSSLVMKMDSRVIGRHMNTIWRQTEVTKFLAECEQNDRINLNILSEIVPTFEDGKRTN